MTIIFERGDHFWIETFEVGITLGDAAGVVDSSAVLFAKSGIFLGASIQFRDPSTLTNAQAVGNFGLISTASGFLSVGDFATGVILRINKIAGTDGNTPMVAMVSCYLKGRGRN